MSQPPTRPFPTLVAGGSSMSGSFFLIFSGEGFIATEFM